MSKDLAADPVTTIGLCQAAHSRLLVTVGGITDEQVRGPSRLPNWTIGHVLTHIARNADGHARRLDGALRGEDLPRYAGGTSQRNPTYPTELNAQQQKSWPTWPPRRPG